MILVLKGADFSANNIGKVALELDERTKVIISKYGRAFSTEEAVAIQAFMNGLDDSGILSKLRALYMPAFASSLEDSFVNLASTDYTKDLFQGTGVSFSNGGIINDGSMSGFQVTRSAEQDIKRNDIFQAVYGNAGTEITQQLAVVNSNNIYSPALIGYNLNPDVMIKYSNGAITVKADNSGDFTHRVFKQNQYGIAGINYTYEDLSANRAVFLGRNGYDRCAVTYKKGNTTLSYAELNVDEVVDNTVNFLNMKSPCKMIVVGKALTDEQLTKFYHLVNNVMEVFS